MVQWARYTLFTTVTGQQVLNKTCLKCWGPLRKERLKSSEGDKEDSRQHIHSPFSSAQKVSACAVVFSRLISSSFSVEEEQEEYIRPPPPAPTPPIFRSAWLGLTWLALHELSEPSCFLILHSFPATWWKAVIRAQRNTCISIYVDELEGRHCPPNISSLPLVYWSVFSVNSAFF